MLIDILTLIVLTLTLAAVVWYTIETHKMQKAVKDQVAEAARQTKAVQVQSDAITNQTREITAQTEAVRRQAAIAAQQTSEVARQIKVSIMPSFITEFAYTDEGEQVLVLNNVGNGVAINITIDNFDLPLIEGGVITIRFSRIPLLQPKQPCVAIEHIYDGYKREPPHGDQFDQGKVFELLRYGYGVNHPLRIKFQDLEGTRYVQPIRITSEGWKPGECNPGPVELLTPESEERARQEAARIANREQQMIASIKADWDSVQRNRQLAAGFFDQTATPAFEELQEKLEKHKYVVRRWSSEYGMMLQIWRNKKEWFHYNIFSRVTPDDIRIVVVTHEGDGGVPHEKMEGELITDPGNGSGLASVNSRMIVEDFWQKYQPHDMSIGEPRAAQERQE
jgi:hypothetical protein